MPLRILSCLLSIAAVAACSSQSKDEQPPIAAAKAFTNVPLPPDGQPLGSQGGSEALQLLVSTPHAADTVLTYYRGVLAKPPYQLINESTAGDTTTFYVTSGDEQPMWIRVERLTAGGTMVRIVGAPAPAADSTGGDSTKGT